MALPAGEGSLTIIGVPNLNVGSVMKCIEAPTWTTDAPPLSFAYNWKYRTAGGDAGDWTPAGWVTIADPTVANLPTFTIDAPGLEYQLGIRATDDNGDSYARYSSPTGPSTSSSPITSSQYVARNADNTPKSPQPGDVEVTDAFGNVFDNFNEYGVGPGLVAFYDKDNVLKSPQPAYQNLGYVSYLVDNTADPVTWLPDAQQWVARYVDNTPKTPQPYVKSPLYPNPASVPATYVVDTFITTLNVEESEAVIVMENDISEIRLENAPLANRYRPVLNVEENEDLVVSESGSNNINV